MKVDFNKLDRAFHPKCIVVIGDSKAMRYNWLKGQRDFKGKLYSVHVNPDTAKEIEAMGIKNYPSLLDVPDPVDLAIVAAPRGASLSVLDDCIRKDVAVAHFFTAGFAETGTEEGIELEQQLKEKAESANFHLVGPNCMGIFNPKLGVKQQPIQYSDISGPVAFISQSGTHAIMTSVEAHYQGVDFNKSVSFGNGTVLDSPDYLEYFGNDPEIKAVGMYLEGVRNGRRFLDVLKEVSAKKPVMIWKGGRTEEGGRAIASHTGSLAVSQVIWDTAVRQCGAISVPGQEEFIDTTKALMYLTPVSGNRVGIVGGSGGLSVDIADVFAEMGLRVPALTKESNDEFATFFSLIGGGYSNPIDTLGGNTNRDQIRRCIEIVERDANIDNVVLLTSMHFISMTSPDVVQDNIDVMGEIRERGRKTSSAIVSYSTPEEMAGARELSLKFHENNVPAYPSVKRAAFALHKAMEYYQLKNSISSQ